MSEVDLSQVAKLLRPVSKEVFDGKGKLCLSTVYLHKLNRAFEENIVEVEGLSPSFNVVQTSNAKTNLIRDIQFLLELVERTVSLKIVPDLVKESTIVNLNKFKNVRTLQIDKVEIKDILGIQKLRSQIEQLSCSNNLHNLSDILDKCGGDNSQKYSWNELKRANFSHNCIIDLDNSLECTAWLNTLDLSYNQLRNVEFINNLPNLKQLNISYNKLERIPQFKGQICNRLQVLILSNNFIEDLSNLTSLRNLVHLDVGQNCLLDHKSLLSVSHLASLQILNLQGNPLSYHPHHRNLVSHYLNKNAASLKFVLDNIPLNMVEKSVAGSFYPISQLSMSGSLNSDDSLSNCSVQEKPRKIRNVRIQDEGVRQQKSAIVASPTSLQHLEIKKQVEQLRKEYGESWLYRDSGLLVQDVLGFEKSSVLSSTPLETAMDSLYLPDESVSAVTPNNTLPYTTAVSNQEEGNKDIFHTATNDDTTNIFSSANTENNRDNESDMSDEDDICLGGEEGIYLATLVVENKDNDLELFVVVTDTHISERDVTTSKEKARWHVNTVVNCEKVENEENIVKVIFDTVRRDRKQRIYKIDDAEAFYLKLQEKIQENKQSQPEKRISYQCMKCSDKFSRYKKMGGKEISLECPKCNSNLVVEVL